MIRVLIADDQEVLAEGIGSVLSASSEIEVIGTAKNGEEAVRKTKELVPDVVLMDIRMPVMNGVIATREIKDALPDVKVLVLTTFDDSDYILGAINNGASGYLLKDTSASALIDAVRNAFLGDTILPAKIARRITDAARLVANDREIRLKRAASFSDRETEIALMICDGFTNKQIASALKLTDGTARNYISAIYEKLCCGSRTEAVQKMRELLGTE